MGCNSSKSADETQANKPENQKDENENKETIEPNKEDEKEDKKEDKKEEKKEDKKDEKKNEKKEKKNEEKKTDDKFKKKDNKKKDDKKKDVLKINDKKRDNDIKRLDTDENKDGLSNVLTEGVTSNEHKLVMHKQHVNGVTLMKGIEECFSEDLNEDEVYQLVEDALGDNITDDKKKQSPSTITTEQAKAVAKIIHNKISNKSSDEDDKDGEIDLKKYPELKGANIQIGVTDLTKDVIRNIMFNGQKVDEYQIDLTYNNLTRSNTNLKALSIQIIP